MISYKPSEPFFNTRSTLIGSQASQSGSALSGHLTHQTKDSAKLSFRRRIVRNIVLGHIELHGRADNALQQGIVQVLRDSSTFS